MERSAVVLSRRAATAFLLALLPAGLLAANPRWIWSGLWRDAWFALGGLAAHCASGRFSDRPPFG
jgi:hypothetical protein